MQQQTSYVSLQIKDNWVIKSRRLDHSCNPRWAGEAYLFRRQTYVVEWYSDNCCAPLRQNCESHFARLWTLGHRSFFLFSVLLLFFFFWWEYVCRWFVVLQSSWNRSSENKSNSRKEKKKLVFRKSRESLPPPRLRSRQSHLFFFSTVCACRQKLASFFEACFFFFFFAFHTLASSYTKKKKRRAEKTVCCVVFGLRKVKRVFRQKKKKSGKYTSRNDLCVFSACLFLVNTWSTKRIFTRRSTQRDRSTTKRTRTLKSANNISYKEQLKQEKKKKKREDKTTKTMLTPYHR